MYSDALRVYIYQKGIGEFEKVYEEMGARRRRLISKKDISNVAKQFSLKGIQGVKEIFSSIFSKKERENLDEK